LPSHAAPLFRFPPTPKSQSTRLKVSPYSMSSVKGSRPSFLFLANWWLLRQTLGPAFACFLFLSPWLGSLGLLFFPCPTVEFFKIFLIRLDARARRYFFASPPSALPWDVFPFFSFAKVTPSEGFPLSSPVPSSLRLFLCTSSLTQARSDRTRIVPGLAYSPAFIVMHFRPPIPGSLIMAINEAVHNGLEYLLFVSYSQFPFLLFSLLFFFFFWRGEDHPV